MLKRRSKKKVLLAFTLNQQERGLPHRIPLKSNRGRLMIYEITLKGCDDETTFTIELTDQEKNLIDRISELSLLTSQSECMPKMYVNKASREEYP